VERALRAMWCGETGNESQRKYSENLRNIIDELFAPKDAVPVVQCTNAYEPVSSVSAEEAKYLVGGLWTSTKYDPYEHQYQCWRTLLKDKSAEGKPMSICVTTGTGSGKTECFMMPLVKDLIEQKETDQVQALFLYPLNALMEDQKERLEELLKDTNLTYTVYNGDLPDYEPKNTDTSKEAERLRKRIRQIRGWDEKSNEYKFKHLVYTREKVRKTHLIFCLLILPCWNIYFFVVKMRLLPIRN
jgi:DEAD/DEAH box helicase domain-containing protein